MTINKRTFISFQKIVQLIGLPILALTCCFSASAQITVEGTPPSFKETLSAQPKLIKMPAFDLDQVLRADETRRKSATKPMPARFGYKMKYSIDLLRDGTIETLANGDRVYQLAITSKGALSMNYLFSDFHLPEGAELYLYNKGKDYVVGAITDLNNKPHREFSTAPIPGEVTYFEYYEPANVVGKGSIVVSHVVHAYRDIFGIMGDLAKGYGDSGPCNIDVECPLGSNYQDQINSVSLILVNGNDWCSGSMVNNTLEDGTPYYLTADHCLTGNLNVWNFVWNYQSPTCGGADGSQLQSISGATLRASSSSSDFALLELSAIPPPNYVVYYAGWDNSGIAADSCIAIHHPAGDVKKISKNTDPLIDGIDQGPNYWRITEWEQGTTEGGSSGSPIFDPAGRVVGQLFGGIASCTVIDWDEYGKFSVSWNFHSATNQQLKHWLDPNNTNVTTLNGRYFSNLPSFDMALQSIDNPPTAYGICDTVVNATLNVRNAGDSTINFFDVIYNYNNTGWDTMTWTGTLSTFQNVTFDLPSVTLPLGTHTLTAYINMPNDSIDYDSSNDSLTISFSIIQGHNLEVEFKTDGNSVDNVFELLDASGTLIHTRTGFTNNATYTEDFCLSSGCYKLALTDEGGNGLNAGAFFAAQINGIVIDTISGTFGSDTIYFCVPYDLWANGIFENSYCTGEIITPKNISQKAVSYSWSMPNATPNSSTAAEPDFTYATPGTYTVSLTVTDAGGAIDDTTFTINVIQGNELTIDLFTDFYPSETSYRVEDENGVVVFQAGTFDQNGTLYSETFCLPDGCYDVIVEDSFGDGFGGNGPGNPPGSLSVSLNGSVVNSISGDFGSSHTMTVCMSSVVKASIDIKTSFCINEAITPTNTSIHDVGWNWTLPSSNIGTSTDEEPTFHYPIAGSYPITLQVTDLAGNTDDTTIIITITNGRMLTIDLMTDNYPGETTYELMDSTGSVVFASGNFTDAQTLHQDILCLAPGCYSFVIFDSANDGICCGFGNGNYTITGPDTVVIATGGQFGASEIVNFCIIATNTEAIPTTNEIKVFPNPTSDVVRFDTPIMPITIEVIDLMGRPVQMIQTPKERQIDLGQVAAGVYFVRFRFEGGMVTKRIIKN